MAAKEKDAKALPEGQAEKGKKPSKLKRIVIILAILLIILAGGGAGAYWWFFLRTPAVETAEQAGDAGAPAASEGQEATAGQAPKDGQGASATSDGEARVERQTSLPRSRGQVLPLPPVTVNISGASGQRYLKLGMEVEVNADVSAAIKANSARIRDAVIMLLAGKTIDDISSPDGKVLLKAEVAARLNQILGAQRVIRVYFTDFMVQ